MMFLVNITYFTSTALLLKCMNKNANRDLTNCFFVKRGGGGLRGLRVSSVVDYGKLDLLLLSS